MKIVILGLNKKRKTGLETWKTNLISSLLKQNEIKEIYTKNYINILKNLKLILTADISHSYSQSSGTIFLMALRKMLNKPNIHTIHGDYYSEQENKKGLKSFLWIPFNKLCNLLANKITFPSKYLLNTITKREPNIKNKSKVIPNGLDLKRIKLTKGYPKKDMGLKKSDFLIVEVTNFNLKQKAKGVDLLIKDFNRFIRKRRNSHLFIIGGGKFLEEYRTKYESERIKFLGFKEEAIKYIKSCDLFVHYSPLDSFGYVLLEALAFDKLIATKGSPAFKEILSEGAKDLLSFKKLTANKKTIQKYSLKKMGSRFNNLYLKETKNEN
jgi:glycosyltransferase involved in cell wall biosynthesis